MPVWDDAVITHISTPGKPATQNAWLHQGWKVWDGPLAQSSYYADEELTIPQLLSVQECLPKYSQLLG